MNIVELSKSSRAKCKLCKLPIDKAIPRYGEEYEFMAGGESRTGTGWYHFECAVKTRPDNVAMAEIHEGIPNDVLEQIEELKKKANQSAFSVKGISEIDEDGLRVNCWANVIRVMKPLQGVDPNGKDNQSQTIYVQEGDMKRKILLWGKQVGVAIEPKDKIVVIKGLTDLGSDDKLQVNAIEDSEVLINPKDEELQESVPEVEIFRSDKWKRPKGSDCVFENAKTSRAKCGFCEKNIMKEELKIVKPEWRENESTKKIYPGSISFHPRCIENAEFGNEILREAISRLTPELIQINEDALRQFSKIISKKELKSQLNELLG